MHFITNVHQLPRENNEIVWVCACWPQRSLEWWGIAAERPKLHYPSWNFPECNCIQRPIPHLLSSLCSHFQMMTFFLILCHWKVLSNLKSFYHHIQITTLLSSIFLLSWTMTCLWLSDLGPASFGHQFSGILSYPAVFFPFSSAS